MISGIPVDVLEKRAAEQRRHLHNSVSELRQSVRQKLDLKGNVRDHLWPAVGLVGLVGVLLGYSIAGIFTD